MLAHNLSVYNTFSEGIFLSLEIKMFDSSYDYKCHDLPSNYIRLMAVSLPYFLMSRRSCLPQKLGCCQWSTWHQAITSPVQLEFGVYEMIITSSSWLPSNPTLLMHNIKSYSQSKVYTADVSSRHWTANGLVTHYYHVFAAIILHIDTW